MKFFEKIQWASIFLILILLLGFGIRMVDLTDLPFDFFPIRQHRSALVARSIYYQIAPNIDPETQALAEDLGEGFDNYEPHLLESMVAVGYLIAGAEKLWISRIFTSLFWVIGGVVIYALTSRFASKGAGLLATAYYLILPFAVTASRSFQPDPFMTMWIICTMYGVYRWAEDRNWKWAVLTGLFGGMAALSKVFAAYFIGTMMIFVVLGEEKFKQAIKDRQVWAMGSIMVAIPAWYYLFMIPESSSQYFNNWVLAALPRLSDPSTFVRWMNIIKNEIGLSAFAAGLTGVVLAKGLARRLLSGLWVGYLIYGLSVPLQIASHTYYHVPFIPIVAVSLAPLLNLAVEQVMEQERGWQLAFVAIAALTIGYRAWVTRSDMIGQDYRHSADYYYNLANKLPKEGDMIGLVQEYGLTLRYYGWISVSRWPGTADRNAALLRGNDNYGENLESYFLDRVKGKDYFVVTAFNQFKEQKDLQDYLYAHYPVYDEGTGYLIFDLHQELETDQ